MINCMYRHLLRGIQLVFVLTVGMSNAAAASAAEAATTQVLTDPREQLHFNNENSPDSVLFWHFLENLYIDQQNPVPARKRYLRPGLTKTSDEQFLYAYFVERYLLVNREIRRLKKEILSCDNMDALDYGGIVEAYSAFNQLEIAVYNKHLAVLDAELSLMQIYDVVEAIRNSPSSFSMYLNDYSKIERQENVDPRPGIKLDCDSLEADFSHDSEFSSSEDLRTLPNQQ